MKQAPPPPSVLSAAALRAVARRLLERLLSRLVPSHRQNASGNNQSQR